MIGRVFIAALSVGSAVGQPIPDITQTPKKLKSLLIALNIAVFVVIGRRYCLESMAALQQC